MELFGESRGGHFRDIIELGFKALREAGNLGIEPSERTIELLSKSKKMNKCIHAWILSVYARHGCGFCNNLNDFEDFPIKNRELFDSIVSDIGKFINNLTREDVIKIGKGQLK